jgi:shikimate dehydrogenase
MREEMTSINTETQLCAVIGNPVAHSLSPALHNAAFRAAGLNAVYLAFQVTDLAGCMSGVRALQGFRGLSVTIPHKVAILSYLDEIQPLAQQVGCVNTVVKNEGRLIGAVTDGMGVLRAFTQAGAALDGKRILFAGTGGAARAAAFALLGTNVLESVCILGRTPERMHSLVEDLKKTASIPVVGGMLETDLTREISRCDVIINATPIGMFGHAEGKSCIPKALLRPEHIVFDMVYRPMQTQLIQDAQSAGCSVIFGLEMLLQQAILQFELWMEQPAPERVMRRALLDALGEKEPIA